MTYTISKNEQYKSLEVSFPHKPAAKVLEALKSLRFRWSPSKSLWFGFSDEHTVREAIQNAEQSENELQTGTIYSDGYMGAIRTDGINSNKHLYGADLTEAIRNHLKRAGIKGATVSRKKYSGGQTITVKVKFDPERDLISRGEFLDNYYVSPSHWYYYDNGGEYAASIHGEQYYSLPESEQPAMRRRFADWEYNKLLQGESLNIYYLTADRYSHYTSEFFKVLQNVNEIVSSYRYDDSNGMVDYFNTNFYYDIDTVPQKKA